MCKVKKGKITYVVKDKIQLAAFKKFGYEVVGGEPVDYSAMSDEQIISLVTEKGIDTKDLKTRDDFIKALK